MLRHVGPVAEELVAAGAALGFGLGEIRGVITDVRDHVAGRMADGCIRIVRGVVEDPNDLVVGLLGGSSFLCSNGAKCNEHGGIGIKGIVQ